MECKTVGIPSGRSYQEQDQLFCAALRAASLKRSKFVSSALCKFCLGPTTNSVSAEA
jgi:hypothetical protein